MKNNWKFHIAKNSKYDHRWQINYSNFPAGKEVNTVGGGGRDSGHPGREAGREAETPGTPGYPGLRASGAGSRESGGTRL